MWGSSRVDWILRRPWLQILMCIGKSRTGDPGENGSS
jgi:hypothetical protein